MFWDTKTLKELDDINQHIEFLEKIQKIHEDKMVKIAHDIDLLIARKPDYLSAEEKSRLADLEVKMAKLWSLLVETTPLGKEKLSKIGRRFGGQSRVDNR